MNVKPTLCVLALTQGKDLPSSRFRWQQHVGHLKRLGIASDEAHVARGSYPPASKVARPFWLAANLLSSLQLAMQSSRYQLTFLQRELISTLQTAEVLLKRPFVFDVDDSIFLNQRFSSVDKIASRASLIICGNAFLADHFSEFGEVRVLPTAVDTEKFKPSNEVHTGRTIGWSGSSSGFQYLLAIEPALKFLMARFPDLQLKVVADTPPELPTLPRERVLFERWNPANEAKALQPMTIGIMPLADGLWERGKCSLKLLTYMAVGIPVVASSVGMNVEVLKGADAGLLVRSNEDWIGAISQILTQPSAAQRMGEAGRRRVVERYSRAIIAPQLAEILRSQAD